MKLSKKIFDVVQSGKAIGANRPCGRVTIEPDWQLYKTDTIWNNSIRGPFRYWQTTDNDQVEVELPNIQSINIERSLSQDIATCNIMMYNQWHEANGAIPEMLGQLGKPGFFWPDRGKSAVSQELWGQSNPVTSALYRDGTVDPSFDWTNVIVPNGLIRTYQGYGGHDLSIDAALDAEDIVITGVWLIDRITAGTDGMLKIDCRDMGRLLLEQMVYPPLVPPQLYPLEYYPPGQSAFDSPWGPRYNSDSGLDSGISSPAAFSEVRCFYKSASTDVSPGSDTAILGRKPSDAADDNITNFAFSQAVPTATDAGASAWWEFWVGESYRGDSVTFPPDRPSNIEISHNTTIASGQSYTVNGAKLIMQTDGNLVLYSGAPSYGSGLPNRGAVWSSGTAGRYGAYAKFKDGILKVIKDGVTLWSSETFLNRQLVEQINSYDPSAILSVQADHNLVIYSKADDSGNREVRWETQTWISLLGDPTIPAKKINSISFKPWAGGYTAYVSVWNLETGAWHTPKDTKTYNGIPYAGKIDTALSSPDGMEAELIVQFDTEILTNRIRIAFSGPFYYSGQPDGSNNQYRCGLRTIKARSRGLRVTEYDGDPNDLPWTYAFEAHPNRGYWVADRDGNVYGFGDAADYDSSSFGSANITSAGPYKNSVELFRADSSIEVNTFKKVMYTAAEPWWNDVPRNWLSSGGTGAAKWITDNEGTAIDAFADSVRWFKRDLTINGNATIYFTCDNEVEVFLDGVSKGIASDPSRKKSVWATTYSINLGTLSGSHELKFRTVNYEDTGAVGWNPTALIWTLRVNGAVVAYSDYQTQVAAYGNAIMDIAATPSGMGYWLIDRYGQVFAFGDAEYLGQTPLGSLDILNNSNGQWTWSGDNTINFAISGKQAMAIAATPTGQGYWILFSDGHVYGFGDARFDKDGNAIGQRIPDSQVNIPNWDWDTNMNPYRTILPPGPMTAPMEAQKVPYIVKVPERNALGYRLKEYPGSAYSWARRGTAICSHPKDIGFWATDGSGQVWAYGACESNSSIGPNRSALGDLTNRTYNEGSANSFSLELFDWPHSIESTASGKGYWIAFGSGKIAAFGDAVNQGPIDIYKDNPQIKIMYNDDLGNDWTYERNQVLGLARNRAPEGQGKGFWVLQADGKVRAYNADYWGQPGYYGWSGLRWHDGNINDYADIVKDLAAWCGFTAYDPSITVSDDINIKNRPQVWGNIEFTGIYSDVKLPGDKWDKRTPIDCINEIKQIVGYNFWIEDDGRIRFEPPNWWSSGNFDQDGLKVYVTYDENGDWTRCESTDPDAVQLIPEIHESVNMLGYSASLDGSAYVSEIIVGSDQPDFKHPNSEKGYIRIFPKTAVEEIRPGVPALRGIVRTAVRVNNKFTNREEQKISAELTNLQIWFAQRLGSLATVANPNLQINDQIRIIERNTSETYIHYVRGISSSMNLDSGEYTMNLTTNRLGTEDNWVITTSGEYNPMDQYPISEMVDRWQQNMNLGVTASTNMGESQPTLVGGFVRR
jgi:hypothetical protein